MASSAISPLRLAGSRLTSTTAGRAMATNSLGNARALQEEEHEAVRQHLEAMGHQDLEYRQSMLFKRSPINTQRALQQDSQSGLNLQSIRSFSTSQSHQASMTSQSVMTQEADEDIHKLHKEAMQQRSQKMCALQKVNESLITIQRPLQRQTPHQHIASLCQSVRSLHTNIKMPDFMDENETSAKDEIISLHNEALENRQQQIQKIHQAKGSLITQKKPKQMQQTQFQSVRSIHTNARAPEFAEEVPQRDDILSLHKEAMEQRQQQMKELSQTRGSLITNKRPVQMQNPQFQSVRSLHTNIRVEDFAEEVHNRDEILSLHTEAMNRRQIQLKQLSKLRESLINNKINATKIQETLTALQ